jgi:hypothetical protein
MLLAAAFVPLSASALAGWPVGRIALLPVVACAGVLLFRVIARDRSVPSFAEFDGRVIEAWIEETTDNGENANVVYMPCVAIDDGVRDQAWAVRVSREQYAVCTPGTLVHVQVNPRRNELLAIKPVNTGRTGLSGHIRE